MPRARKVCSGFSPTATTTQPGTLAAMRAATVARMYSSPKLPMPKYPSTQTTVRGASEPFTRPSGA